MTLLLSSSIIRHQSNSASLVRQKQSLCHGTCCHLTFAVSTPLCAIVCVRRSISNEQRGVKTRIWKMRSFLSSRSVMEIPHWFHMFTRFDCNLETHHGLHSCEVRILVVCFHHAPLHTVAKNILATGKLWPNV